MRLVEIQRHENTEPQIPFWFMVTQLTLRFVAIVCTITSIVDMVTSDTSVLINEVTRIDARYYYYSAFKFLLGVDAAVCALVTLSLIFATYVIYKRIYKPYHWYYLFLHDLILMTVLISAFGGALSIGYVGIYGQSETFWNKICDNFDVFCVDIGNSIGFSFAAFLCLFALTVVSSNVLMKPPRLSEEPERELVHERV